MAGECARIGCSERGTKYIAVAIPPKGYPIERGIEPIFGVALCPKHAEEAVPEDFISEQGKRALEEALAASIEGQPAPLDFDRAEKRIRDIGDKPWRQFMSARAAGEGGGNA